MVGSDFETISRFVYSWLLGKINTDMHEKVADISNKNGYKLYQSITNSVDAIPANAELTYDRPSCSSCRCTTGR